MNAHSTFDTLFSGGVVERLGWVLVHSTWQFALVALLARVTIRAMQRSPAATRYGVLVVAMVLSVAAPAATWLLITVGVPPRVANQVGPSVAIHSGASLSKASETRPDLLLNAKDGVQPEMRWLERAKIIVRPWLGWIVVAWILGVGLFSARPLFGWYTLRRLQQVGVSPVSDELMTVIRRLSDQLGLCGTVRLLQSTLAQAPMVVGYFRPVILLPASLVTSIPAAQLDAILAHELAHVRQHDFVVNLLQAVVETLFFYHPAVWWLSHRIRIEREFCCDDFVVKVLDNRIEYGRALIAIEQLRSQSALLVLGASDGSLVSRVRRIIDREADLNAVRLNGRWPVALFSLACLGVAIALPISLGLVAKGEPASINSSPPKELVVETIPAPPDIVGVEKPIAKDLQAFQGIWRFGACESMLWQTGLEEIQKKWQWTIHGQEITWTRPGSAAVKLSFTVDPSKSPSQIDLTFLDGPNQGEKCRGIYKFERANLWICITEPGASVARPTQMRFSSTSGTALLVLQDKDKNPTPAEEARSFQGIWKFDIYYSDWWPERITNPPLTREKWRWTVKGNEIRWSGMKIDDVKLSFTLDPSKSPKEIDLTFLDGPHKGKKLRGIYKFNPKGVWQICFADPDAKVERPTDVLYSTDEGRTMVNLERPDLPQSSARENPPIRAEAEETTPP